jgi:hypothetical protein
MCEYFTEKEKKEFRNGRVPWVETYPNGSVAIWFTGHIIHVKAPNAEGTAVWSKSFPVSICDNRKYGEHHNAIKRKGVWRYLTPIEANGGWFWK